MPGARFALAFAILAAPLPAGGSDWKTRLSAAIARALDTGDDDLTQRIDLRLRHAGPETFPVDDFRQAVLLAKQLCLQTKIERRHYAPR